MAVGFTTAHSSWRQLFLGWISQEKVTSISPMFHKWNCFVYVYIQYYGLLKSSDCEGTLDAPWFSMASQAQPFESGHCATFPLPLLPGVVNLWVPSIGLDHPFCITGTWSSECPFIPHLGSPYRIERLPWRCTQDVVRMNGMYSKGWVTLCKAGINSQNDYSYILPIIYLII